MAITAPGREPVVRVLKDFLLREYLPGEDPAALKESTRLYSTGILDSIGTLKLVAFVEETFGITIDAHEAASRFDSVGEIADLVVEKGR
jgi:acyl carrier protein